MNSVLNKLHNENAGKNFSEIQKIYDAITTDYEQKNNSKNIKKISKTIKDLKNGTFIIYLVICPNIHAKNIFIWLICDVKIWLE